jgi:hypothetical protein
MSTLLPSPSKLGRATSFARADLGFPLDLTGTRASVPLIQRKATVSSPDEPLERDADRVADNVMRMIEPSPLISAAASIQRQYSACREKSEEPIHAAPSLGTAVAPLGSSHADLAASAARGTGAPLSDDIRSYFEPRFRRDFSEVRVHASEEASDAARTVHARAYTLGTHIVFGRNEFSPSTTTGRRLLAHELAHVAQQQNGVVARLNAAASPTDTAVVMRDALANGAEFPPLTQRGNADCGATPAQSLPAQPAALRTVLVKSHGSDADSWFEKLGDRRATLTSIYTRLCNYGLWDDISSIGKVYVGEKKFLGAEVPGNVGHVDFIVKNTIQFMRNVLGSSRFCADHGVGGSQHANQASFREIGESDSLHIAVGPQPHIDAHIDRYSSVKGGGGSLCVYDPTMAAAHIGNELVPGKVRSALGVPGVQVFPESPTHGTRDLRPDRQESSPSILGLTLRF